MDLVKGHLECSLPALAVPVTGDPEQISRVLDNLLNNALTYRRGNQPPWVRLEVSSEKGQAAVAMEDRGRGVPPEMRERIFERFVRADELTDRTGGTGLGLYISQQLAQRHGGVVELQHSVPGEGSRFVLRLPLAAQL